MNITSNILGELGASVKRSSPGVQETLIAVPPTIIPSAELRNITRQMTVPNNLAMTQSFITSNSLRVTAGAISTIDLCILDVGFWEVVLRVLYSSNYASATLNQGGIVFVTGLAAQVATLMSFATGTVGGTESSAYAFKIMLDFPLTFTTQLTNNAAGQDHLLHTCVIASKLL